MFRNQASTPTAEALVGRPPTPPKTSTSSRHSSQSQVQSSPYFTGSDPRMNAMQSSLAASAIPRQTPKKSSPSAGPGKSKNNKGNTSILSFFGKASEVQIKEKDYAPDSLFFEDRKSQPSLVNKTSFRRSPSPSTSLWNGSESVDPAEDLRFNEINSPSKRRKLSAEESQKEAKFVTDGCTSPPLEAQPPTLELDNHDSSSGLSTQSRSRQLPSARIGGFIDDSDSDAEEPPMGGDNEGTAPNNVPLLEESTLDEAPGEIIGLRTLEPISPATVSMTRESPKPMEKCSPDELDGEEDKDLAAIPTTLASKQPSVHGAEVDDFAGLEDFDGEEFFEEGEEYMERKFMEEQELLERDFEDDNNQSPPAQLHKSSTQESVDQGDSVKNCPICTANLDGITETEASAHVNACLDGKPIPLPSKNPNNQKPTTPNLDAPTSTPKRFQRAAIARPAQDNPYSLSTNGKSKSAFSQLMSGHAEDAAWAAAANNEVKSRGKPAYDRTCPFYKIMPGLLICVDAFRYGAVEGQKAYFLSHFHSDHYIGLTSSWCHGPIYCSKVTGNLVRQSLRVNPKWVVDLEFERKAEVPGTQGVYVTMLPANHCPGSSLFLFEKALSQGPKPKLKRILHCGDFRACPAHVNHPLLRPSVQDSITGVTREQTIDTCYLDTTYLTPKYAFPSQEDVIGACAQMCMSLSKEIVDSGDHWEQAKRERAGSGMVKFLDKGPTNDTPVKIEEDAEDTKPKRRGRLLVVIGTYSIGKERICLGIARALNSKIYAPPSKQRICACLEDLELTARLTSNPLEAQVHMQMLMEIRAETLADYLSSFRGKGSDPSTAPFARVVGFRPTGWNYRPPTSRFTENPAVSTVLHSEGWKSRFTMRDLVPQRGSTKESHCFGVPYSEHSSFRELTMFCTALRIGKVVPTVNVGSQRSRERMKGWVEKWEAWKRKEGGFFRVEEGATSW